MRILKTTQSYFPYLSKGGQPGAINGIASTLVRRGHVVTVLTADLGETDGGNDLRNWKRERTPWGWESRNNGVEGLYLSTLTNYRATTVNPGVASFCTRRLHEYDLVHVYGLYDLIGSGVAWFCRRRGIPYVLEPLGMFGPKIRSLKKKRLYGWLLGSALFEGAKAVIATSEAERVDLVEGGIDDRRILMRRNGLDLSEFQKLPERGAFRAKHNIGEDQPLLLFLGRLSFIKGLDLLVQAFSQVSKQAKLVIAGPDDKDGCSLRILELIDKLNLEKQIILTGPVYDKDKLRALVDANAFVLPSRHESFGNAAAESIACGTPVLVTDKCGIAPLVDGKAGLVVPCSVEGIAKGINLLLEDTTLLARMREGCACIARDLSWDQPVDAMESLYASLIKCNEIQPVKAITRSQSSCLKRSGSG